MELREPRHRHRAAVAVARRRPPSTAPRSTSSTTASGGLLRHAWYDGAWNNETLDGAGAAGGRTNDDVGDYAQLLPFGTQLDVVYQDATTRRCATPGGTARKWSFETLDGTGGNITGHTNNDVGTYIAAHAVRRRPARRVPRHHAPAPCATRGTRPAGTSRCSTAPARPSPVASSSTQHRPVHARCAVRRRSCTSRTSTTATPTAGATAGSAEPSDPTLRFGTTRPRVHPGVVSRPGRCVRGGVAASTRMLTRPAGVVQRQNISFPS